MLTPHEQLRYSRQILLPQVGEAGQLRLNNASVLIVGLGGLGSPVSLYLAAAGVGRLLLADGDRLDITNLQRQVLYRSCDVGENKAEQAAEQLCALNPEITIEAIDQQLESEEISELVPEVDLVVDCSDNLATRHALNRACVTAGKPLVSGAAIRFEGQLLMMDPATAHACYHCVVPENARLPAGSCQSAGVTGPLLGAIGSLQAQAAINYLLGIETQLPGKLMLYDASTLQWRTMMTQRNPACPVCGDNTDGA